MPELPGPEQKIQEVERETRGETLYVVLQQEGVGELWTGIAVNIAASSAENAVKQVAGENGLYVAVPKRSWKPMRVQQVQTVQTVIEAVES